MMTTTGDQVASVESPLNQTQHPKKHQNQHMTPPSLHLQCALRFIVMPTGNQLPMVAPAELASAIRKQQQQLRPTGGVQHEVSAAGADSKPMIVDAHAVQNISMEDAVAGIARAIPLAMSHEEIMLRG